MSKLPVITITNEHKNDVPLSFNQEQLWFFDRLKPGSAVYNIPGAIRIKGSINVGILEHSLNEIVNKYESLRTYFPLIDGQPVQRIPNRCNIKLPVENLTHIPAAEREAEALKLAKAEAQRPFDLSTGPLFRLKLWVLDNDRHILQVTMHHMISDGWSMGILMRELLEFYEHAYLGKPAPISKPLVQYKDFSIWQRNIFEKGLLAGQSEYWKTELSGVPHLVDLPFDKARPIAKSFSGDVKVLSPGKSLYLKLKELGRNEKSSLFQILLSAFQVLLYRYTGQDDLTIGFLSSNRSHETKDTIGYFVNTLPLHQKISAALGFAGHLSKTREALLQAINNGNIPFIKIADLFKTDRTLNRNPVFQVLVAHEYEQSVRSDALGLEFEYFLADYEKSKFDLTLYIYEGKDSFKLIMEYDSDMFEGSTIERMLCNFEELLYSIVNNPDLSISHLSMLPDKDRFTLLYEWNDTYRDYPLEKTLHELFEEQAERSSDCTAAVDPSSVVSLTYSELNYRANQLARYLRKLGAKPDQAVAIFIERSIEMVLGLLGILKSGAAYMPLDPEYPPERIAFMLEDAQVPVLLTREYLYERLPDYKGTVVFLDSDWEKVSLCSGDNFKSGAAPESLAYVIYTSGSTGRPKGVMNVHRGICNRLLWMQEAFQLTENDRVLQKTPFSFDVSVWEFFWPLLTGARLVIAKPGGHRDNLYLVNLIEEQKITTIHFVPSMLRLFLESGGIDRCNRSLKRVICSGEALSLELQELFFSRLSAELYNLYGPTEAAVDVTWWRCRKNSGLNTVPIGKPIANTQIYILDPNLQPVPVGVPGEIYIGGVNVARGYLNREQLTSEKFIKNPFVADIDAKMYKTGDRARFLPDGNIEFLGRIDHQVKIRGFRVEPGEIETALKQHPAVGEAIVTAKEDIPGTNIITAYITAPGGKPSVSELRDFLKTRLPEYMVPSVFVILDKIPLTASGKTDRLALPPPGRERPILDAVFAEPLTDVEKTLAGIWKKVLKIDNPGIHDKFFELGGDSIRSIQVLYMANEAGLNISLQDIFQNQTISELAQLIESRNRKDKRMRKGGSFSLITEEDYSRLPEGIEDAYPVSMLQNGLVYHSNHSAGYSSYITSYHLRAPFNPGLFQQALDKLVGRHPMLRTSFDFAGYGKPLQLVHKDVKANVVVKDLTHLSDEEQADAINKWIETERKRNFIWEKAPLFRFYIHLRSEKTFQFTVAEPILDGWSVALLSSEIFSIYKNLLRNENGLNVDELPCSYRDYVALEQEALSSGENKGFWTKRLENCKKTFLPRWPFGSADSKNPQLVRKKVAIPPETGEKLKEIAQYLSVPLKSVILAAHLRVIQVLSGQTDILTGLLMNGRPEKRGGDKVIGLFLNTVPFRFVMNGGSWYDLIKAVYKAETELLPFRRYPLAQIQLEQGGALFDNVFNFIHFYPYKEFRTDDFELIDIKANDQTYFPLTVQFSVDWKTSALGLSLDYNSDEFCDEQIESIEGYFLRALSQVAYKPEENYLEQPLLSEKECDKLLHEWNNTEKQLPSGKCFHRLFEEQARLTPGKIAVSDGKNRLTYSELNDKADKAAQSLTKLGVKPDTIVAVFADRDIDFLTVIIGIFKAGGAYLPLHTEWPAVRIRQILEQSGSKIIIAKEAFIPVLDAALSGFKPENGPLVVSVNELYCKSNGGKKPEIQYLPNNLAYVIYTSGSTGIPKGAMIEHRGMLNHLYAKIEDLRINEDSVVAQTASQCFDISVWQFLAALLAGGRVEIAHNGVVQDPVELAKFIKNSGVNIFETVPSMLRAIIDGISGNRIPAGSLHRLRWLIVTGEAFPSDLLAEWFRIFPQIPVVNAYGPTECSDDVTHYVITSPLKIDLPVVPIGKPILNTKIYILDKYLKPVPVGVPGEIYVGGAGVGRGYLNDSFQTQQSFLSNTSFGTRLYKTGDLARFLPDGNIEFLGRIDHQVKIRGFRIEIGEIENVLRSYKTVRDCIVQVCSISGEDVLAAYIVFNLGCKSDTSDIRTFLRQQLPEYMIPSVFVELDCLPVNQNGKIDRKALPKPSRLRPDSSENYKPPESDVEKELASIWEQVLGIDKAGVNDSFFDLGGHSLQAVQLVSKISAAFSKDISVNFLLRHPTIAQLAEAINAAAAVEQTPLAQAKRKEQQDPSFSHVQFESRSLQKLFNYGKIEPVDAAAFGYLPDTLTADTGLTRYEIINGWMDGLPETRRIFSTPLGRILHVALPIFASEIYHSQDRLLDMIMDGLEIAGRFGAGTVSLTGLLPSATEYGRAVIKRLSGRKLPEITTGHAATASAVIFSTEKILSAAGRDLSAETVGLLGAGSIGASSLKLMLKILPHPKEIILCDVYGKIDGLIELKNEITGSCGFNGKVEIIASHADVPPEFYKSTLVIGAASVKNILDVWELKPGTIIVDDSAPHCFDTGQAFMRLESQADILFTEGGILKLPQPIFELRYLPEPDNDKNPFRHIVNYRNSDYEIMGCIFSSILPAAFEDIKPIIGLPGIDECVRHYHRLKQLGCTGSELCCRDLLLPRISIERFCEKYGNKK